MPNSLVTGGAGFIGSHVADSLLVMGHRVVVLDDLSGGFINNIPLGSKFVNASILDAPLLEQLFLVEQFDYVYHLAAYAAEGLSHHIKRFNYMNNLVGSMNLINAAVNYGVKRFIFTSSMAVYGSGQTPFSEETVPEPEDSYGIAKLAVERELQISHRVFSLEYTIFRPHNVYGERQNTGDKYRNVVGIFMNQCLRGELMTIFGDGEQQRAFSYIGDVAPVIAKSSENKAACNQIFNIGSDEVMTINRLSQVVADAMCVKGLRRWLPERLEVKNAFCDHRKISGVFGTPTTSIEDGIERMAAWTLRHGSREVSSFSDIEISKCLPESWKEKAECAAK